MKNSSRRQFLQKSAIVTLGAASAGRGLALGETEAESNLRSMDQDLAKVLRSYGRTRKLEKGGQQKALVGSRTRKLPVSRLSVDVDNRESLCASFDKLTQLSDQVLIEGNTVRFARDGHYFVLENRVA